MKSFISTQMRRSHRIRTAFAAALCVGFTQLAAFANDPTVGAAPTETPLAKYSAEGKVTSIGWYFISDAPRKDRQVAQTLQVEHDGVAKHFAVEMAAGTLSGLGPDATYSLTVYESQDRPDRHFVRKPVLEQQGVVHDGEGDWLIFPLSEELPLKASHFYTFALQFTAAASGNKVVFKHSQGDSNVSFRWHRSGRDRWIASPLSLHYLLY